MAKRTDYTSYLRSPHWHELKASRREQVGPICENCVANRSLHGHHLVYREPLDKCTVDDIILVCEPCHTMIHGITLTPKKQRRMEERAKKRNSLKSGPCQKMAQLLAELRKRPPGDHHSSLTYIINELISYRDRTP